MSIVGDAYAAYVVGAYAASAAVLGTLIWSSIAASRRARRELEGLERERRP
jgi:heme exporter protein CcmD